MSVTIYVEGGGDSERLQSACREAFRKLLARAGFAGRMPRIVVCSARGATFDDFRSAHRRRDDTDYYPILLVDSEAPVSQAPWEHLQARDGWHRPEDAEEDQAQLMVACMETWIMADRAALRRVFGQPLRENALFPVEGLEQREKDDVQQKLEDATRGCPRARRYRKGRRSFQVVSELDPDTLAGLLPYFARLLDTLRALP